ncbi:MAG: lyase family protein [Sutterellaceae bacterium]|nr:lyase family protein [Sutterellaceae bacterium]
MQHDEFFWISQINKASVVVNCAEGLLPKDIACRTAHGIDTVEREVAVDATKRVKRYIAYEPMVIAASGPETTIVHAGRSSQDILSTMRVAMTREDTLNICATFDKVIAKLLELAQTHRDTIVPNYTNGVAAQPNSYAHYLLGFIAPMLRDRERLSQALVRHNECAMGSTVLNGTGWPLNRQAMSDLLGFDRPRRNAFDCTCESPVDFVLEVASIVGSIGIHVGSMINDIMVQYAQPRPWIILQEGGDNTYVSSAMPQKRNPGLMNNCRADASEVVNEMTAVFMRVHNVVPGMVDGKNEAKNHRVAQTTIAMLERFLKVLNALRINPERALEELNSDWTASQEIADRLMKDHGLPFRIGHHVASRMVSWARANNVLPKDFPYEQMQRIYTEEIKEEFPEGPEALPMTEAEFLDALDPRKIVANRRTAGSAAPAEVNAMIEEFTEKLNNEKAQAQALVEKIDAALAKLNCQFGAYL